MRARAAAFRHLDNTQVYGNTFGQDAGVSGLHASDHRGVMACFVRSKDTLDALEMQRHHLQQKWRGNIPNSRQHFPFHAGIHLFDPQPLIDLAAAEAARYVAARMCGMGGVCARGRWSV
jgi:hypothetical protein